MYVEFSYQFSGMCCMCVGVERLVKGKYESVIYLSIYASAWVQLINRKKEKVAKISQFAMFQNHP